MSLAYSFPTWTGCFVTTSSGKVPIGASRPLFARHTKEHADEVRSALADQRARIALSLARERARAEELRA